MVVPHDRIAAVRRLARAAETRPKRVASSWTVQQDRSDGRRPFAVDRERQVHPLDEVVRTNVAVRVGRKHAVYVAEALEAERRSGHEWHSGIVLYERITRLLARRPAAPR